MAALALVAGCREEAPALPREGAAPPVVLVAEPVVEARGERVFAPSSAGCEAVVVLDAGRARGRVCVDDAGREGLTVLDLSDSWTPRVFQPSASGAAPEYRKTYLELASAPSGELGLHGIAPTLSRVVGRLTDETRARCDASVELGPLREAAREVTAAADDEARAKALAAAARGPAVAAAQRQLVCAGLLKPSQVSGRLGAPTHAALDAFRRRHMIVGGGLDADTLAALSLGGEELALRGVLRVLRERVVDATGLVEDGSALGQQALVVGRELDLTRFTPPPDAPLEHGAADLVDLATDRAARQLGLVDAAGVRAFAAEHGPRLGALRVAVALPPAPRYHAAHMDLRVEIDRGDVALAGGARKDARRPTFVMYARDGAREVALVRWPTTIGGWKKERNDDGEVALKYKESDVGERVWRHLIAAPAWLPPESTPETDLVRADREGNLSLKRDLVQPGYRNAFGLVMMIHHEARAQGGKTTWLDHGIRSHGSVDYRSIGRGTSHGCHRLHNQLVLRMSGFVLQHRTHARRGQLRVDFRRTLTVRDAKVAAQGASSADPSAEAPEVRERTIELEVPSRGYLYELSPPLPVRVLEGRVTGRREAAREPAPHERAAPTRT